MTGAEKWGILEPRPRGDMGDGRLGFLTSQGGSPGRPHHSKRRMQKRSKTHGVSFWGERRFGGEMRG